MTVKVNGVVGERQGDGGVKLVVTGWDVTLTREFSARQWAELVAGVSAQGLNARSCLTAYAHHGAEVVVLPEEDNGSVLVVHGEMPIEVVAEMGKLFGCTVLQLPDPEQTIEVVDEDAMRAAGWIRVKSVDVTLDDEDVEEIGDQLHHGRD